MNKMSDPYTKKSWRLALRWKYHDFKKILDFQLPIYYFQKICYLSFWISWHYSFDNIYNHLLLNNWYPVNIVAWTESWTENRQTHGKLNDKLKFEKKHSGSKAHIYARLFRAKIGLALLVKFESDLEKKIRYWKNLDFVIQCFPRPPKIYWILRLTTKWF